MIIYALLDPNDMTIRYIGKSINPIKRFYSHLKENGNTRKCRWISKLIQQGQEPLLDYLEIVSGIVDWQSAEKYWIKFYRDSGNALCNLTDCGEGVHNPGEESREKLRKFRKVDWITNREKWLTILRSPERCQKISKSLSGRPKSSEHISKLPQNKPGRKIKEKTKRAISEALIGNQHAKGSNRTPEQIEVQRKVQTGKKRPRPNTKSSNLKRSKTLKGRSKNPEWKEKLRQGALRRWSNPEQKRLQSERTKKQHQNKMSCKDTQNPQRREL